MRLDSNTRAIPLTKGYVTFIDAADYEMLSRWKWQAVEGPRTVYAQRHLWRASGDATAFMHRTIMLPDPRQQIDHVNHNGLDNRRANLRVCTPSQNCASQRVSGLGTSPFKGVFWHKQTAKWAAFIKVDYQPRYLGLFTDDREAALAYDAAARDVFGEFALTNFPEGGGQNGQRLCHSDL
jgi:hypothetical protein